MVSINHKVGFSFVLNARKDFPGRVEYLHRAMPFNIDMMQIHFYALRGMMSSNEPTTVIMITTFIGIK